MTLTVKRPSKVKDQLLQEVRSDEAKPRRMSTDIEPSLYRRIKTQAAKEDRSISDITRQLWLEYLARQPTE